MDLDIEDELDTLGWEAETERIEEMSQGTGRWTPIPMRKLMMSLDLSALIKSSLTEIKGENSSPAVICPAEEEAPLDPAADVEVDTSLSRLGGRCGLSRSGRGGRALYLP